MSIRSVSLISTLLFSLFLSGCGKPSKNGIVAETIPLAPSPSAEKNSNSEVDEPITPPSSPPSVRPSWGPVPGPAPSNNPWVNPFIPIQPDPKKPAPPVITPPAPPVVPPKPPAPPVITPPAPPKPPAPPVVPPKPPAPPVENAFLRFFTRPFAQAYGVYDRGRLEKPDQLPNSGNGILKIFQPRNSGYGTRDLTSLLTAAGQEIHRSLPATEVLQIGDISDQNGGRLGGHGSHQNGLDADVAFLRRDRRVMDPTMQKPNSTGFDESFVTETGEVTNNFDTEGNWTLIQLLVGTGRIDRIFIDQAIKKEFCNYAVSLGRRTDWSESLRKLRHWKNHQDHMHIRATCPPASKNCKAIAPIPAGDGCDNLLDTDRSGAFLGLPKTFSAPMNSDEHMNSPADEHGC